MRNSFLVLFLSFLVFSYAGAESLKIQANNITLDKKNNTSIFEKEVNITTEDGIIIKGDFVKYDKKNRFLTIKENIVVKDKKNNLIKAEFAEYDEVEKIFISKGLTEIITSDNYKIFGEDIIFDNKNKIISSNKSSTLQDLDNNQIFLANFNYNIDSNIFKSIGLVKIKDKLKNNYEFSQIYIDTKKKEILGTDIKAFLNYKDFKINEKNDPRIFANSIEINKEKSSFNKSIFTLCGHRKNDKCPPWSIQSSKMLHDSVKKTLYYDNAVIKVYDIPIFFFPKLSHPDPSVERRSGFLPPSVYDTKNLGAGISVPYFFDLGKDKNFTLSSRLYVSENPLFLGEYHQVFKNSNFLADFGYTEGYKRNSASKKAGEKSHLFSKFIKNFKGRNNSDNTLDLSVQHVSNDKYLKLYKIKSNLADFNQDTLENSIKFTRETDDSFLGLNASIFETLKGSYNDKYEYILPEIIFDKNLFNDDTLGTLDLQTNLKVHNYDTNKLSNFLINDLNWQSKNLYSRLGFKSQILANLKNINYEAKNVNQFKENTTHELFGALGFLTELDFQKNKNNFEHLLTPKIFVRLSPGSMRSETSGTRLNTLNAFSLDRLDNQNNYETGISGALGLDYKIKNKKKEFDFSIAQVVNEKENNKMADITSLNEKLSDLVGSIGYSVNDKFKLNYNFSLDQNYQDLNYNEVATKIDYGTLNFNFNYLQEKKHIGDQDYFTSKLNIKNKESGLFTFENKRNLITNSSEFYNLSYEYINDCLRAGLVYRREFYNDSELEPENSLMFKITLTPFGSINSPTFSK